MGCDVWYDFKELGYTNMNYILDWGVILYCGQKDENGTPMWRVSYPEAADLSTDSGDQIQ